MPIGCASGRAVTDSPDLRRFLRGEIDPRGFTHREHVRMAFELLKAEDFLTALTHYAGALRGLLARVGRQEAFNHTITIAYLALIAERMQAPGVECFEAFAARYPELFEPGLLHRWYEPQALPSPRARRAFLMPAPHRDPR
jgi:hypothetical protein